LLGYEVAVGILLDQPPLALQSFVERRPGNRLQHADHCQSDAVSLNELELVLEDRLVVVSKPTMNPALTSRPALRIRASLASIVSPRMF